MKVELSQQSLEKYSNIKFHENLFSGSWVVPWLQTDRYDKLIVAFYKTAKVPKNCKFSNFVKSTTLEAPKYDCAVASHSTATVDWEITGAELPEVVWTVKTQATKFSCSRIK